MRVGLFINAFGALLFALLLGSPDIKAQQIYYSVPLGDNIQSTSFDIIGQSKDGLLIYKKSYNDHVIERYDQKMKLVDKVPLDFLPSETKMVNFINLHDQVWMIYQYIKRRDIYCEAVRLAPDGSLADKPFMIDKTVHPYRVVGDKAYTTLTSKDKNRILIFEILRNDDSLLFHIRTFLFDSTMTLLHKGLVSLPYSDPDDKLRQITLSDKGGFYFLYGSQSYLLDPYFKKLSIYYKLPLQNKLISDTIPSEGHLPKTTVLMQINDEQGSLWVNTLNYGPKLRHINYLGTFQLDADRLQLMKKTITVLNGTLRQMISDKKDNPKYLFDNYVLKDLVLNKNNEGLLIAEKAFLDRNNETHRGDIGFFDMDSVGKVIQIQKIDMDQGVNQHAISESYLLINTGHTLHFLLNKSHQVFRFLNNQIYLLRDFQYDHQHQLKISRVMRGLDNKVQWLPHSGKQITRNEVVIPCIRGGSLLFGKIIY